MNLDDTILSEISSFQKNKYLKDVPKVVKLLKTESRMVLPGNGGKGKEELFIGYRVSVLQDVKVLEIYCTIVMCI